MRIEAVINKTSGSVPTDADEALARATEKLGHTIKIRCADPSALQGEIVEAINARPDLLIMWGGDGSVAMALTHSAEVNGPPVLPLQGGTMNLLHKSVHGEIGAWQEVLEKALHCEIYRQFPVGHLGEHKFYVGFTVGRLSRLQIPREELREGQVWSAVQDLVGNGALALDTRLEVEIEAVDGGRICQEITSVGGLIKADDEKSHVEVGCISAESGWELAKAGISATFDDWRNVQEIDYVKARSLYVADPDGDELDATIDGEFVRLPAKVRLTIEPLGPKILCAQ